MITVEQVVKEKLIISTPTKEIAQMVVFIVVEMGYNNPLGEGNSSGDIKYYGKYDDTCIRISGDSDRSGYGTRQVYKDEWGRTVIEHEQFLGELSLDALDDL